MVLYVDKKNSFIAKILIFFQSDLYFNTEGVVNKNYKNDYGQTPLRRDKLCYSCRRYLNLLVVNYSAMSIIHKSLKWCIVHNSK
jgi:hypothetical protein